MSEIMTVTVASVVNAPLPLLPLQILFLNIVTDVFPALALAGGEGARDMMSRPPRHPGESIVSRRDWLAVASYGVTITASVLGAMAIALNRLEMPQERAVTISFITLGFVQLWHVFNMREPGTSFLKNSITRNSFVWVALFICSGFLVATVYVPGLSHVLKTVDPGREGWVLVLSFSLIPFGIGQVLKKTNVKRSHRPAT
jgi:Ca2+-transporting ATPase